MLLIAGGVFLGLLAFALLGETGGKILGSAIGLLLVVGFVALVLGGAWYVSSLTH